MENTLFTKENKAQIYPIDNREKEFPLSPELLDKSPNLRKRDNKSVNYEQIQIRKKPANLLAVLYSLIRIVNTLKFRTKFRNLKNIDDEQVKFVCDCSYFPEKKQKDLSLKRYFEKKVIFF